MPIDAWTSTQPPQLFGVDFHQHPTLPLWVLHTWLWKDNPAGVFAGLEPGRPAVPGRRADLRRRPAVTRTEDLPHRRRRFRRAARPVTPMRG